MVEPKGGFASRGRATHGRNHLLTDDSKIELTRVPRHSTMTHTPAC